MDTQGLKHRAKDETTTATASFIPSTTTTTTTTTTKNRKAQKLAMAKRGLRSLAVAIAVPFILATLAAYISGTAATASGSRPFLYPPAWAFHVASISASCLMGLSAWLVWADGGFHRRPIILAVFLAQFVLGLAWGPLVCRLGAARVGLVVCVIVFAALYACSRSFHCVNPIAGDLVKLCLAWVSFLAVFNYKLV